MVDWYHGYHYLGSGLIKFDQSLVLFFFLLSFFSPSSVPAVAMSLHNTPVV